MASREAHYRALSTRLLKEQLSPQLKALIKKRSTSSDKITQSDLALRLGYNSLSGLQAVMNGRAQPKLHHLIGLAIELELHSLEELFGDFGSSSAIIDQED